MQAVHFGEVMKNMQRPTRKQAERIRLLKNECFKGLHLDDLRVCNLSSAWLTHAFPPFIISTINQSKNQTIRSYHELYVPGLSGQNRNVCSFRENEPCPLRIISLQLL